MIDINTMLQCLIIGMLFIFYLMGYMVGCLKSIQNGASQNETRPQSFFDRNRQEQQQGIPYDQFVREILTATGSNKEQQLGGIAIDERKIVTDIKTDGMQKKYEELGETKTSNEDISGSVNKLKGMKR